MCVNCKVGKDLWTLAEDETDFIRHLFETTPATTIYVILCMERFLGWFVSFFRQNQETNLETVYNIDTSDIQIRHKRKQLAVHLLDCVVLEEENKLETHS